MGEAHTRRAALVAKMMRAMEELAAPDSPFEQSLREWLPMQWHFELERQDDAHLIASGMKPQDCHLNCFYQQREAILVGADHKIVSGWLASPSGGEFGYYIAHSVISTGGRLVDITPRERLAGSENTPFVPDTRLNVRSIDGLVGPRWGEDEMPIGTVRLDVARAQVAALRCISLLKAGTNPHRILSTFL